MKKKIRILFLIVLPLAIFFGCEKATNIQYHIDNSACNSCSSCIDVCPVDAIDFGLEGKAVIDQTKCNRCGQCIVVCPKNAIY